MWTSGSVEGLTLKIVAQNAVDHSVNVVLTSSRDRALTDNNMSLLLGIYWCVWLPSVSSSGRSASLPLLLMV
jgi:hypothetical protein